MKAPLGDHTMVCGMQPRYALPAESLQSDFITIMEGVQVGWQVGNQSAEVALIWEHISTTDLYVVEEHYKGGTPYLCVSNE